MLPVTPSALNVPTDVILGCAAVVTVPAVVAVAAEPALAANVALATVPVTLAPVILLRPDPLPLILAPVILPLELNDVSVPTDVILGWAAVVTVPAVVAVVADPTVPVTLAPVIALNPDPLPLILAPVMLPLELNDVNVPTLVILGCAAVVTVPAVAAEVALATVPVTLAPTMLVNPDPLPTNLPVCAITSTVAMMLPPVTLAVVVTGPCKLTRLPVYVGKYAATLELP